MPCTDNYYGSCGKYKHLHGLRYKTFIGGKKLKKLSVIFMYVGIVLVVILLLNAAQGYGKKTEEIAYQQFISMVKSGEVGKVVYQSEIINGWKKTDETDEKGNPAYSKRPDFTCEVPSLETFENDIKGIVAAKLGIERDAVTTDDYETLLSIKRCVSQQHC